MPKKTTKLKDKLKNVLKTWTTKSPAHKKFLESLPKEIQEAQGERPSYYDFVVIQGTEKGPDGTLGTFALANGRSGDIEKYPLPQDAGDPKSVFLENGLAGMLKSVGADSKIVEVPGSGIWHLRKDSVVDLRSEGDRPHPLKQWHAPSKSVHELPRPLEVTPRTAPMVEDLYDPDMPPRRSTASVRVTSAGLVPLHGLDARLASRLTRETMRVLDTIDFGKGFV